MSSCFRVVFVVVVLSLLASRATADSPFRLQAGATTAQTGELMSTPGFTLGGAVALARWAPLAGVAFVPQLELLFARRSAGALADGVDHGSSAVDVLELPLVLRGELTIGSRTFHMMGGAYGSVLLRAHTMDDRGNVEPAETSSPVDIGWVAAGGFTLASLASGELSLEMRYQRGYRGYLLDGEGGAQNLSLLLAYGLCPRGSDSRSAGNPDPSLAFKGGLVATRLQLSGSAPSDYRPGFAFGGSYSPFRLGSGIALRPQVELSFVRRNAAEAGPADSSLAMDSIDLSVLARGELVASGRTVYGISGIYGSLLFDAQRNHEGRITDMGDTLSSVDAGRVVGAGIELFSIAAVKPAVELRYQRGFRNLLPAGPGEVHQQSLSCLVSITYGGSSPAGSRPIPHTTATAAPRAAASRGSNSAVRPSPTGASAGGTAAGGRAAAAKQLAPRVQLTQRGLEHIVLRHWATSGAKGDGKFAAGTTAQSLQDDDSGDRLEGSITREHAWTAGDHL